MNIGKFSVSNNVLITILMISLLVFGAFSMLQLPREQFSEVPFYWANIIVAYPGVSAEDVESSVTVPIENEMDGIDDLKRIQSVSSEGLSVVRVEFDDGIDDQRFKSLFQDVQTRLSGVSLPDGTLKPLVDDFSSSDFLPVIEAVIYGEASYSDLVSVSADISSRIENVTDVSGVEAVGQRERKIFIDADKSKMEALGVSLNELIQAVQVNTGNFPGGSFSDSDREYLLRTIGEVAEADDMSNLIVRRNTGAGSLRILDLAEVVEDYDSEGDYARFNSEKAVILRVAKVPGGNSVTVAEGVKSIIDEAVESGYPGLSFAVQNDSTVQISNSIGVLLNNALFGLLLLVIILFVFIGLRNALMTALGIPLTFAITFIILDFLGETFNTNTLFGLVLVLGLVVDHAIVIIENSFRFQQTGLNRRDAAVKGVNQVVVPIIAATATTIAAFLHLMILPGTIGKFLRVIPLTVSIALIASTFEAVFFIPSHYADWPGGHKQRRRDWFERIKSFYENLVKKVYSKKKTVLLVFSIFLIGSLSLVPFLGQDLFSAEDYSLFYIDIEMAPGTTLEKTTSVVSRMEEKLTPSIGNGEIVSITSSIGFAGGSSGNSSGNNIAQITVDLTERSEGRTRSIARIMDDSRGGILEIPGPELVILRKATNGPPVEQAFNVRLEGDNYENLKIVSGLLQNRLRSSDNLINIKDNLEVGKPEARLRINGARASELGLSARDVGNYIRASFDGITATTIFRDNEEIDVIVGYRNGENAKFEVLRQMKIPTVDGRLIPLSAIGSIEQGRSVSSIKRVDGKREITISADAYDDALVPELNSEIEEYFNTELRALYPGVELKIGGEFAELSNLIIQILRLFLIGVFLIYLILGTQFKSFTQPVLIMLTVPFSFAGVILYLAVSGTPFSTTVLYAAVALAGIAVNDSIVLVSFINELRAGGKATFDAVIEAATTRLRPIILTSVTTIAGLLPTAVGLGGRSVVWQPMATTIVFGLIFSTLTALLFIPALYGALYGGKK
ncbi:MAG: efflux RND transporter permease subunit [Spirochaetales bacterium]|uniref:Efflux RND transporter permease subunit n=1 Tax=Candidatus Thalassospirochaeta sargassi TaxID=3119039 RepID=A0AAJ1MNG1_9SPIO|nr:efflux RND transporter permease subunit [Spirochaetales bacterium]